MNRRESSIERLLRTGRLHGGGKGGSSGTTTATTTAAPWSGQQGALQNLYGQAQNLPLQQYYPWQTWANIAPQTQQAWNLQQQRATAGSPVDTAAQEQLQQTLEGDYLYGGPGFDRAFQAARADIIPDVQSRFEQAGRFGSGLARQAETEALGDAFARLYGQERQRQMQGVSLAPGISALDYRDIAALGDVGFQAEQFEREKIADALARQQFAQQAPYQRLAAQSAAIQGGFTPGQTTTRQPYYRGSPLSGAIGGALTGAGLSSAPAFATGGSLAALGGWPIIAAGAGLGLASSLWEG